MYSEKKYFSIGEVAKLKKVTIKALRYYHEIGLLVPSYIDETNGYRYYSLEQFLQIDIIKLSRSFGVSIKELQKLFSYADMDYLNQFIKEKNKEIQEQINQLKETKSALELISSKIDERKMASKTDKWKMEHFPARYLITAPVTEINEIQEMMGYHQLENKMDEYNIQSKYEYGTLYTLSTNGDLKPLSVFEVIGAKVFQAHKPDDSFMKIPSGYFLTYTFFEEIEMIEVQKLLEDRQHKQRDTELILSLDLYADIFNGKDECYQVQIYIGKTPPL